MDGGKRARGWALFAPRRLRTHGLLLVFLSGAPFFFFYTTGRGNRWGMHTLLNFAGFFFGMGSGVTRWETAATPTEEHPHNDTVHTCTALFSTEN